MCLKITTLYHYLFSFKITLFLSSKPPMIAHQLQSRSIYGVTVTFAWHKKLAERLHHVVSTHQIRIDQNKFPLTVTSLSTAVNKPGDIWDIDKQQTSHLDAFDGLRMCMLQWAQEYPCLYRFLKRVALFIGIKLKLNFV
jgi:hypothetical protein